MKKILTYISSVAFVSLFVVMPLFAFAQEIKKPGDTSTDSSKVENLNLQFKLQNPIKGVNTVNGFLSKVLDSLVFLLTPVLVIMIIWTGFLFVKAQGNPAEIKKARQALMYTLIGAALILGAKGFALAIEGTVKQIGS